RCGLCARGRRSRGWSPPPRPGRGGRRSARRAGPRPERREAVVQCRDTSPASFDALDLVLDGVEPVRQILELSSEPFRELAYRLFELRRARGELLAGRRHPADAAGIFLGQLLIDPADL